MQRLNTQRGITLISLMIGTVFSMLTILAMLALYKNLIQVSVEAIQDANHDGGLASAMLTAQLELQSAGFGMSEDFDQIVFLHKTASTNAILWYYKPSPLTTNQKQCVGLIERQHPADDKKQFRTLTLLKQPNCNLALNSPAAASPNAGWESVTDLAVLKKPDPDQNLLQFVKKTETCSGNYSSSTEGNHQQIEITALSSSALNNIDEDQLKIIYTICLLNISAP